MLLLTKQHFADPESLDANAVRTMSATPLARTGPSGLQHAVLFPENSCWFSLSRRSWADSGLASALHAAQGPASATQVSNFLPTSRKLVQFSSGKAPKPTDKIVYVDGGRGSKS